jgi:hypothetical protein
MTISKLKHAAFGLTQPVRAVIVFAVLIAGAPALPALAQAQFTPGQLNQVVARIALYPDPLLAQVLTSSTYSEQLPDAAEWADKHSYLKDAALANAVAQDNLPWDPSVLALMPFPSVLWMMASDMFWTRELSDAVFGQRAEVMDAVQAMRQKARNFGYLQSGPQYRVVVSGSGIVEILPVDPAVYYLPAYDPQIVFARPRAGLTVGLNFGPRIGIGAAFRPWGWGQSSIAWSSHTLLLAGRPWARTRSNRDTYVHPYPARRQPAVARVERHEVRPTRPVRKDDRKDKNKDKERGR